MMESIPDITLTLQRTTKIPDRGGRFTDGWGKISDIVGKLRVLSGRERYIDQRKAFEVTHRFYCTTQTEVKEEDQFLDAWGRAYRISSVDNPMQMNHHLQIDLTLYK